MSGPLPVRLPVRCRLLALISTASVAMQLMDYSEATSAILICAEENKGNFQ